MTDIAHINEQDPWLPLARFTRARIALGRTGISIPAAENLRFKLAHAFARDAVFATLNIERLQQEIEKIGIPSVLLRSQAHNRQEYLQRPGAGRTLDPLTLANISFPDKASTCHISISICDGLSATAINHHAANLLMQLVPQFISAGLSIAPVAIVENGRVAIGDETGQLFNAALSLVLIGERPGLSSPDSLGVYLTFDPRPGNTDAMRNCISNIHAQGIGYKAAAGKIIYLVRESLQRKISGVGLKDGEDRLALDA